AIGGSTDLPCPLPFARHRIGRPRDDAIRPRALSQVAIPMMPHPIRYSGRWREQIENQVRVAGIDREFVTRLEVRRGARVVADDSLARRNFYSAHVLEPAHVLNIASMQMRGVAGRSDLGVVVKEKRDCAAGAMIDCADVALDEFRGILD